MLNLKKSKLAILGIMCLFLSACAPEKDIILEGKRQTVFTGTEDIKISLDVPAQVLPEQTTKAKYDQYLNTDDNSSINYKMSNTSSILFNISVSKKEDNNFVYVHVPVLLGNTIYLSSNEKVYAYDLTTKKKLWSKSINTKNLTTSNFALALDEALSQLFVVSNDGAVVALNLKDGSKAWTKTFNKPFTGSIANKFGLLYLLTSQNELLALDSKTGDLKWQHKAFSAKTGFMTTIKPAFVDDVIIAPYNNGEVYALNAITGDYIWQDTSTRFNSDFSTNNILRASPVIGFNDLILTTVNGILKSVNLKTEATNWSIKINPLHTPAKYADELFVITTDGIALNINNSTGKIRWATNLNEIETKLHKEGTVLPSPQQWTMPVLAGDRLFFFSSNKMVVTLNPKKGTFIKAIVIDKPAATTPIVANDTMFVMLKNGNLLAIK